MLAESMPACTCGNHDWKGGGGYVGPGLSYTCFTCNACGRTGWAFDGHGTAFIGNDKMAEDYINNIMMTVWRAAKENNERQPMPPQLPAGLDALIQHENGDWIKVDFHLSQKLQVPPDPIRIQHDEFWTGVLGELGIRDFTVIDNQYDGTKLEPWFQVLMNNKIVTFGPRKRVLSLRVKSEEPFYVSDLAEKARADNTSYWADDLWHEWNQKTAKEITVHAWGKEKFIEYFRTVLSVPPGGES